MSKSQREKGKRGEREAAKYLTKLLGTPVTRAQQYKGGQHSADLDGTGLLHVEVKRMERINVYDAIEQADADAGSGSLPILLHRRSRKPWLFVCYLQDLLDVMDEVHILRNGNEKTQASETS